MQTFNISNFTVPATRQNSVKTSLDGMVVTPFNQNFNKSDDNGFDLSTIINDERIMSKFQRNTLPRIEIMTDGGMFINPRKYVIGPNENYYIKWLVFNKNFEPVNDHNYQMTRIPKNGYMMKIVIPNIYEKLDDIEFVIEYVIDINNIKFEVSNTIGDISPLQSISDEQTSIHVTTENNLYFKSYTLGEYKEIDKLILDKKSFFEKYVRDVLDYT